MQKTTQIQSIKESKKFEIIIDVFVFLMFSMLQWTPVNAHDFGQLGTVFPIDEPDFLQILKSRTTELQQIDYFEKDFYKKLETRMDRPSAVADMTTTNKPNIWLVDPAIIVSQSSAFIEISAKEEAEFYNPLQDIHFNKALLFYNADDQSQAFWALKTDKKLKGQDQLILVKGSVFSEQKRLDKSIYFDQFGILTHFFQIHHVPAIVQQQGLKLKISEVLP